MYRDLVFEFTFIAPPAKYTDAPQRSLHLSALYASWPSAVMVRKHTVSSLSTKPLLRRVASSQWTKSCQPRSIASGGLWLALKHALTWSVPGLPIRGFYRREGVLVMLHDRFLQVLYRKAAHGEKWHVHFSALFVYSAINISACVHRRKLAGTGLRHPWARGPTARSEADVTPSGLQRFGAQRLGRLGPSATAHIIMAQTCQRKKAP